MKTYFKALLTLAIIAFVIGVAGPALFSAKSSEAVRAGFTLLATVFPGAIYGIWRKEISAINNSFKENDTP